MLDRRPSHWALATERVEPRTPRARMTPPSITGANPPRTTPVWWSPRLRSVYAVLLMSAVVIATYIPPQPTDLPPDARPALLGLDFMHLHVRRLRSAHEALFGPQKYLPGWYTRELGGTPFWSNLQNFPLIPIRLVALFARPEDAFGVSVQLAANCAAVFMFLYCRRLGIGRVGCAVAGFTFACSGFFASRVYAGHLPLLEAYPALPLLLWLIEVNARSVAPDRLMPLKLLAAALAAFCIAVAGHPQL